MKRKSMLGTAALLLMTVLMSGCQYMSNRYLDFRDIWSLGAGVTAENPVTGVLPPTFGIYLEASDFIHLGAITHNGYTAELDGRGTYVGPDSFTRFGFLGWQRLQKTQVYDPSVSCYNVFKDKDFPWCVRLESLAMEWNGRPAKCLHYEQFSLYPYCGTCMMSRGWQYWGLYGATIGLSDPLITHWGFMLRFGIDISEISDFLLGWFCIDYKHDDLNDDEWQFYRHSLGIDTGMNLTPARSRTEMAAPCETGV